jgi:hypothetical protein
MTISSRRLARRCRERLAVDDAILPLPTPTGAHDEGQPATVDSTNVAAEGQQEKVDAAK